jgi:hypothetical protein
MLRLSRRRFSFQLSAALGLVGAPSLSYAHSQPAAPHDRLKWLLEATFSDPAGAREIGHQYLVTCPDATADVLELAKRLLAQRPMNPKALRQILSRWRNEDLDQRAFVLVDGWILPRLEAEVCALAALL